MKTQQNWGYSKFMYRLKVTSQKNNSSSNGLIYLDALIKERL